MLTTAEWVVLHLVRFQGRTASARPGFRRALRENLGVKTMSTVNNWGCSTACGVGSAQPSRVRRGLLNPGYKFFMSPFSLPPEDSSE